VVGRGEGAAVQGGVLVGDGHPDPVVVRAGGDRHGRASVVRRVADEVAEDDVDPARVDAYRCRFGQVGPDPLVVGPAANRGGLGRRHTSRVGRQLTTGGRRRDGG
jgi:hypothetical protein